MNHNYLTDLLKDLGANGTPSQSINLTSGKEDGQIDVTRKDQITANKPDSPLQQLGSGGQTNSSQMVTMYHPSGSTMQVYPNEVELFQRQGYTLEPAQVAPAAAPSITTDANSAGLGGTPFAGFSTEHNAGGVTTDGNSAGLGGTPITLPTTVTEGPYTVTHGSPEEAELMNDPSYDEIDNGDGTSTFVKRVAPNEVVAPEVVAPEVVAPVVSPEVYNPGIITEDTDGIQVIDNDQPVPVKAPGYDGELGADDVPIIAGEPADQNTGKNGERKYIQDGTGAWITNPNYAPVSEFGDTETVNLPEQQVVNPNEALGAPEDQQQGINGNNKYIQDSTGAWTLNPAFTAEEETETDLEEAIVESDPVDQDKAREVISYAKSVIDDPNTDTEESVTGLLGGISSMFGGNDKLGTAVMAAILSYATGSSMDEISDWMEMAGLIEYEEDEADKNGIQLQYDQIDADVASGIITPEEAATRKRQISLGQTGTGSGSGTSISKNAKVMVTSDGRRAVFDAALGGYRYTDGNREPVAGGVNTYEPNSANGVRAINKPRREKIKENQEAINYMDFVAAQPDPEGGFFSEGQIGTLFGKIQKIYGGEGYDEIYANYQAGLQNKIALAMRPPGPLSEKEWDYLKGAVPDPRTNPKEYKKYMKAYRTFLSEQNAQLRFVNDYMFKNQGASELDAINAWHDTAAGKTSYSSVPGSTTTTTTGDETHDDNRYG